jgi:hypothetical protein
MIFASCCSPRHAVKRSPDIKTINGRLYIKAEVKQPLRPERS